MSTVSFLEFQYKLSKNKFLRKPSKSLSFRDRQNSNNSAGFQGGFELRVEEMRQLFDKFDSNKDGKISQADYNVTLRALGQKKAIQDIPMIFRAVDLDKDGFIDFKEFVDAHARNGGIKRMDIANAFRIFDLNRDGKISAEEVMSILRGLGERRSLDDCQRMVKAVDSDGDGLVNIDEFMAMMTPT